MREAIDHFQYLGEEVYTIEPLKDMVMVLGVTSVAFFSGYLTAVLVRYSHEPLSPIALGMIGVFYGGLFCRPCIPRVNQMMHGAQRGCRMIADQCVSLANFFRGRASENPPPDAVNEPDADYLEMKEMSILNRV